MKITSMKITSMKIIKKFRTSKIKNVHPLDKGVIQGKGKAQLFKSFGKNMGHAGCDEDAVGIFSLGFFRQGLPSFLGAKPFYQNHIHGVGMCCCRSFQVFQNIFILFAFRTLTDAYKNSRHFPGDIAKFRGRGGRYGQFV